ncbi:sugar phosphate nucleotidyltransferase [Roseibium salinum]|nr:sugar phosphate nucleotidyltransferase [Roseibium salinum]
MQRIYPVILSGGMGSRLWPMSRRLQPKQFQPANGVDGPSFLQATVERHRSEIFHEPTIVGAEAQLPLLKQQTEDIGCAARLIGEPVGRNTGPAVLAAALDLLRNDPDAVMLVLPSDHVISGSLNQTTEQMLRGALEGWIVTLGVTARYPETGFGYITRGTLIDSCPGLNRVAAFVEKAGPGARGAASGRRTFVLGFGHLDDAGRADHRGVRTLSTRHAGDGPPGA